MKAAVQYFPIVLFIVLYKVVLTFESVDEILKCDYSCEAWTAVPFCPTVLFVCLCRLYNSLRADVLEGNRRRLRAGAVQGSSGSPETVITIHRKLWLYK